VRGSAAQRYLNVTQTAIKPYKSSPQMEAEFDLEDLNTVSLLEVQEPLYHEAVVHNG